MEEPFVKISRSPLNNSHAKMLYTFPKAIRFRPECCCTQVSYPSCDRIYEQASGLQTRATSFGYGGKSDFTKKYTEMRCRMPKSPPPNSYNIKGIFDGKGKQGIQFGESRSKMESTGPLSQLKRNTNPGPGSYRLKSMLSKSTYSFSSATQIEDKQQQAVPGPGKYDPKTALSPEGVYSISRFRASRAMSFTANRKSRFSERKNLLPGPGDYQLRLKNSGKQIFSKYKSSLGQSFPHSPRPESLKQSLGGAVPGPGQYQHTTEFGSRAESRLARCLSSRIVGKENLPISR